MMQEPVEERLSRCIDDVNAGRPPCLEGADAELEQLAADAAAAREAFTMPVMPESMEERVWQRVRAGMHAPSEAAGRRGAAVWLRRRWALAAVFAAAALGAFAGMYAPKLAGYRQAGAQEPAVRFLRPGNGQIVSGEVEIEVDRADGQAPERVEVQLDGQTLARITRLPGRVKWDTRLVSSGPHVLSAVAYGADGRVWAASVAVTVVNRADALGGLRGVVLTADGKPAAWAEVLAVGPRTLRLRTDAQGTFRADEVPAGLYTVSAEANGQAQAVRDVEVRKGERPHVTLRFPARANPSGRQAAGEEARRRRVGVRVMFPFDGALLHGVVPVVLELDPAHKGTGPARVDVDGKRVFTAERAPYRWAWDTGEVADGQHEVTFRVQCRTCGEHVFRARVAVFNSDWMMRGPESDGGDEDAGRTRPARPWVNAPPNPR